MNGRQITTTSWVLKNLGTLGGTAATLTTLLSGSILTLWQAGSAKLNCETTAQFVKTFAASNLTFPATNITIYNIPVPLPNMTIPVSELLGKEITDVIQHIPETIGTVCSNNVIAQGAIATALTAGIFGLFAYNQYIHSKVADQLKHTEDLANTNVNLFNEI